MATFSRNRIQYKTNPNRDKTKAHKAIGVLLPFNTSTGGLFESSYVTEDQVLSNLKLLLLTRRGERYGHPQFGTGIYDRLFENITSESEWTVQIKEDISNAIQYWMPYVIIKQLNIEFNPNVEKSIQEHALKIVLVIGYTNTSLNREVVLFIAQNGDLSVEIPS